MNKAKNKNKKCFAVLSSAALGVLIASAVTTSVSAKVTSYVVNDNGQIISFNADALTADYVNKLLGKASPMFDAYLARVSNLTAFQDSVKGFVSYESVISAYEKAIATGHGAGFNVDNFTENAGAEDIKDITVGYEWKDGQVVEIEKDTVAPVITLKGEAAVTVENGAEYEDEGATAADNKDGQVAVKAVISDASGNVLESIDTTKAGTYTITYSAKDAAGNEAPVVTRLVTVKEAALSVTSVTAVTDTKLNVKLSSAVDSAASENFSIAGATINAATLSTDKKEVILDVTGLKVTETYTLKVTGLKVDAVTQPDITKDFTMPSSESLFNPDLTFADNTTVLKADGAHSVLVTFTLKDANGNVMTDADKVEVAFSATFGNFAEKRVTVQNGVATVLLTSESLDSAKNAVITAQVVEASNKNLIGLQKQANITMDPNPDSGTDQTIGATVTEAEAEQADRVVLYFNKEVSVSKYAKTGTNEKDTSKAGITVTTNVNNSGIGGNDINVLGYLPVEGNTKALYAVLDTSDGDFPLVDNANVKVDFTDKTGTVQVPSTKMFKLTDSRRPALLSVAREGLKTLKVTFSEPVERVTAQDGANWLIDGFALNSATYGVGGSGATATVGNFNVKTGEDTRNVVTIALGKDASGNQIYFKSGTHSIQGSSIGDWANVTDIDNNVMNTQTLDFDIPVDTTAPNATVEVQSPEQYVISFDKELVSDLTAAKIKLQKYNKDTATWEDYTKQALTVTAIPDTSKYKVEVNSDWTNAAVYDTATSKQNYYNDNYRLFIAKDTVAAAANGIKNADLALTLGGAMTTPDLTSPIINTIDKINNADGTFSGSYKVTMSEPVKGYDGLPTLAQTQVSIPTPTAQFVKNDGSKTIDATVEKGSDAYDEELKVTPNAELEAGDWTVVVRSISDDIGNTAASATKGFTVTKETSSVAFKALWAYADTDSDLDVKTANADNGKDYVYVKFNKAVSITGDAINALKTSNYLLDGMALPTGTQIRANIAGYDDKDNITDSITIVLPDKYLNGKNEPHVLTISSYIKDTAGDVLTNGGEKKLSWNYISPTDPTSGVKDVSDESELKAAIADDTIREIDVSGNITLTKDLSVSRAVDINLKGNTITGNVAVNTTDSGVITYSNGTITGNLTIAAPNADFVVGAGLTVNGTTTIKDVLSKSFINNGNLAGVVIEDPNGASFTNNANVGTVTVDASGTVTLSGTFNSVQLTGATTIVINGSVGNLTVGTGAQGASIAVSTGADVSNITVLANGVNIAQNGTIGSINVNGSVTTQPTVTPGSGVTPTTPVVDGTAPKFSGAVVNYKSGTTDLTKSIDLAANGLTGTIDLTSLSDTDMFTGIKLTADTDTKSLTFDLGTLGKKTVNFTNGVANVTPADLGLDPQGDGVSYATLKAQGALNLAGTLTDAAGNSSAVKITLITESQDNVAPKLSQAIVKYKSGATDLTKSIDLAADGLTGTVDLTSLSDTDMFTGFNLTADTDTKSLTFDLGTLGTKTINFTNGVANVTPQDLALDPQGDGVSYATLKAQGVLNLTGTLTDTAGNSSTVTLTIN